MEDADDRSEMMVEFLRERDEECPGCGYNLRALTGKRCPECNQELVLRVGLAEPRLAWFVGGVIGIAMGLGFSSMVLIWAAAMMVARRGIGGPRLIELLPLVVGTVVGSLVMWWWVRGRRRFAGAKPEKRWLGAGVATALVIAPVLWFFAMVR